MNSKKLAPKLALVFGLSMTLGIQSAHADLVAIGLGIITAPITLPIGIYESIKSSKSKKEQEKRYEEAARRDEEYKRAELEALSSFVQRGCKFEDLASAEFKKVKIFSQDRMSYLPSTLRNDYQYYSDDSSGRVATRDGKVHETFGQIDDIPLQDARKFAVKKLKEMEVSYTNSSKKLVQEIRRVDDLNQLSKEDRQLALNFACDSAQLKLSTTAVQKMLKDRATALQAREDQKTQTAEAQWKKAQNDIYGVH